MGKIIYLVSLILLMQGCSSVNKNVSPKYVSMDLESFISSLDSSFYKNKETYILSKNFIEKYIGDSNLRKKVNNYCIQKGGLPMNNSISFNTDTKLDTIPSIVVKYVKQLPKNNIDYEYIPCIRKNQNKKSILFAMLASFHDRKNGGYDVKFTFFSDSKKMNYSIKKKKEKLLVEENLKRRNIIKIRKMKQRMGAYVLPFFIESKVGKLDIYNKNMSKPIVKNKMITINERLCETECIRLNELATGYASLYHAEADGWKIISKTKHFHAREIKRVDNIYCSCLGSEYLLRR